MKAAEKRREKQRKLKEEKEAAAKIAEATKITEAAKNAEAVKNAEAASNAHAGRKTKTKKAVTATSSCIENLMQLPSPGTSRSESTSSGGRWCADRPNTAMRVPWDPSEDSNSREFCEFLYCQKMIDWNAISVVVAIKSCH